LSNKLEKNQTIKDSMKATHKKRKTQVCKVFTCKVDKSQLSNLQKEELDMMRTELNWYWNDIINKSDKKTLGDKAIKAWKYQIDSKKVDVWNIEKECYEKRERKYVPVQCIQKLQDRLCANIRTLSSLKKKGLQAPGRIQRKCEQTVIEVKQVPKNVIHSSRSISFPGVTHKIHLNGLKQFYNIPNLEIACMKALYKWSGDDYYIQFTCYVPKNQITEKQKINKTIGIDFGCETSFTTSEGKKFDYVFAETERLKMFQKKKARQIKGSNRYIETCRQIKKSYEKIDNQKKDATNKFVAYVKQFDKVVIQDEQLRNWHKNGHGKAVQHSILGRVKSRLKEMDNVAILSRFAPTTKLCRNCGRFHDEMTVADRIFECSCGVKEDRDVHAAQNMIWMYENNIGMEHTNLKRSEVTRLVTKALESSMGDKQCSERVRQEVKHSAFAELDEQSSLASRTVIQSEGPCSSDKD
jgi:putative transposase